MVDAPRTHQTAFNIRSVYPALVMFVVEVNDVQEYILAHLI